MKNTHTELSPLGFENHPTPSQRPSVPWSVRGLQWGLKALGSLRPGLAARVSLRIFLTPQRKQPRPAERDILKTCEPVTMKYQGLTLKGYALGQGPVVLLVHGWNDCSGSLSYLMPRLAELGFRAIAFDGPAHGLSDGAQTNLRHYGGYIHQALQEIRQVHAVIAHSFGGSSLLLQLAESKNLAPLRTVTIGSPSQLEETLMHFQRRMGLTPPVARAMEDLLSARLRRSIRSLRIENLTAQLPTPALIVHDQQDRIVPADESIRLHSFWPGSQLLLTEGLGHIRVLRDPSVISKIGEFLKAPPIGKWHENA